MAPAMNIIPMSSSQCTKNTGTALHTPPCINWNFLKYPDATHRRKLQPIRVLSVPIISFVVKTSDMDMY